MEENKQEASKSNFWKYYLGSLLMGFFLLISLPGSYSAHGYSGGDDPTALIITYIIAVLLAPVVALIIGIVKKNPSLRDQALIFVILYAFIVLFIIAALG